MEGLRKENKELLDTDNSVVIARGGGWSGRGYRGINGNGKSTIKNILFFHPGCCGSVD